MTLKEMFSALLPFYNVNDNNNKSIQCEKIADDYAIEFAEWCLQLVQYCETIKSIRYYNYLHGIEVYTNLELLEIFKKEKGL